MIKPSTRNCMPFDRTMIFFSNNWYHFSWWFKRKISLWHHSHRTAKLIHETSFRLFVSCIHAPQNHQMPPLFFSRLLKNSSPQRDSVFQCCICLNRCFIFTNAMGRSSNSNNQRRVFLRAERPPRQHRPAIEVIRSQPCFALSLWFLHWVQLAEQHMTFLPAGPLDWLSIFSVALHICQKVSILENCWVMPSLKMWLQEVINENFQDKKVLKDCVLDIFSGNIHSRLTLTMWGDLPWDF